MGTRSTIHFYNDGINVMNIYTQYDGYLEGVGKQILDFFENKENRGNGIQDDALLYVLKYKDGAYNMYATTEINQQEYNYYIYSSYDEKKKEHILEFRVTREGWFDSIKKFGIITLLNCGTFEDFKRLIENGEDAIDDSSTISDDDLPF